MQDQPSQAFLSEQQQAYDVFKVTTDDKQIVSALRARIGESEKFYSQKPYNLAVVRKNNNILLWGDPYDTGRYPALHSQSIRWTEPQIFVGIQTIVAYMTDRVHEVSARPGNDSAAALLISRDFEKFAQEHAVDTDLLLKLARMLYDLFTDRVAVLKFTWNPTYNGIGDIIPMQIDPANVVFDHTAGMDDNPGFIAEKVNCTIQQLCERFPDKKDEIYKHFRIVQGTQRQLGFRADYYEVWLTGLDKDGHSEEQLVCFMGDMVLFKGRNPHWLYDVEEETIGNAWPFPPKPYLTLNLLNKGKNKVDHTSLIELVADLQHALNRLKRGIGEQALRYSGLKVWSGDAVDKEDVEDLTGEPDESIVVQGENVNNAVTQLNPVYVPQWVPETVAEIRETIHSILGTPPNMRGDNSEAETLGEAIIERDQSQGRMSPLAKALDSFMNRYYKLLFHFVKVYYTEEHWKTLSGEDGTYEFVMMHRDRLKDGLDVRARGGTNLPLDEARLSNIAVKLMEMGKLSTLDGYRMLKLPKAEELYDHWVKEQTDPTLLMKDIKKDEGDRTAEMDYELILVGKDAPPRDNPEVGHIDTHREQMSRDEFQDPAVWTPEKKAQFMAHVQKEVDSLRRRAEAMQERANAMQATQAPLEPGPGAEPQGPPPPSPTVTPPGQSGPQPAPGNVAPTPMNPVPIANGAQ